jgi:hypothetical protein
MLRRLVPLVGINAVPLGGVFLADWSPATALSLYWWENLIGAALVALRIALHRALTRKRGHHRLQLGLQVYVGATEHGQGRRERKREDGEPGSFLGEFVLVAGGGTAVHGVVRPSADPPSGVEVAAPHRSANRDTVWRKFLRRRL